MAGTLGKLLVTLGLDSSEFSSGLNQAASESQGLASKITGTLGNIAFGAAIAGVAALGGAFVTAVGNASEAQDVMAQTEAVIKSTGGAAGMSAKQMGDLASSLSAANGVSKFGDEAILTGENLLATFTNIGSKVFPQATQAVVDMATALHSTPEAMSMLVGKALNSADGLTALKRSGVSLSDSQIELAKHLFDTGHVAEYQAMVLKELSNEFGGSAAASAATFSGQIATLKDKFGELLEGIGTQLLPALTAFVGFLNGAAFDSFSTGLQFVIAVVIEFGTRLVQYGVMAYQWGANIANQFAGGIADAISAVVAVMQEIGAVIASWLAPGSPPKITPDLDKWGTQAATLYFDSWGKGDTSVFNAMASTLQATLKGLVDTSAFPKEGVIPTMLAGRSGLQQMMTELTKFGNVSDSTFNSVIASMGPAGGKVAGLVRAYIDLSKATNAVSSAQQELNDATKKYDAILSPLNAQMKQLQDRDEQIKDMQRIQELNKTLGDSTTTEADKELARNEIAEINLKHQIKGVVDEKDAVVAAAQVKLNAAKATQDAAQKNVDTQQALIDNQNETNTLIGQQISLMTQMAKASAGSGGGGAGGGIAGTVGNIRNATAPLQAFGAQVSDVTMRAKAFVDSIGTGFASVGTSIASVITYFMSFSTMLAPIIAVLTNYAQVWINLGITIFNVVSALVGGNVTAAWNALITGLGTVVTAYTTYITSIYTLLSGVGTWLVTNLALWGQALANWITPYIPVVLAYLQTLITAVGTWITAQATVLQGYFMVWATAGGDWVTPYITIVLSYLQGLITAVGAWIAAQATTLATQFATWAVATYNWIPGATVQFLAAWPAMLNSFLDWIATAAGPILAQLGTWAITFVAWIAPQIPAIIVALAGIAAAIAVFIGETAVVLAVNLVKWAIAMVSWIVKNVIPQLPTALNAITAIILSWINAQVGPYNAQILAWVMAFTDWVSKGVTPLLNSALASLGQMILAWINAATSTAGSEAFKIGSQLIAGIVKGLGGGSSLNDAIQNIINNALGVGQSVAKIHSPSQLFADELGVPMVLGVVEGMNATMPKVLEWVRGNLGKKLAGYLTDAAGLVRGAFDISQSLHDLAKVDPYQPLADATNAYQAAQKSVIDTSTKLNDINQKIADTTAAQGITRGSDISGNKTLLDLYQQQADAIKAQADAQKTVSSAWDTQINAMYTSEVQQHDVAALAVETQRAYTQLEQQSQAMMGVDAKQALDFFNQRKSQIAELADLQKKRILETDPNEQAFLDTQIKLLQAAQGAESTASQATVNISVPGGNNALTTDKVLAIVDQALKAAGLKTDVRTRTA